MMPSETLEIKEIEGLGAGAGVAKREAPERVLQTWFALRVRARHEKSVFEQLEAKGYNAFLPLYTSKRRWADRWKTLSLPLFPGYVFCWFDAGARARVLSTPGIIDVVRIGSEPASIDASEMEAIRRVAASNLKAEPYPSLARGQHVIVTDGPLEGVAGTLVQVRNSYRLVISVDLLQRSVQVEIERDRVIATRETNQNQFKQDQSKTGYVNPGKMNIGPKHATESLVYAQSQSRAARSR